MPSPNVNTSVSMANYFRTTNYSATGAFVSQSSWADQGATNLNNFIRNTVSVQTPNYRNLKSHQLPNNPYTFSTHFQSFPRGYFAQRALYSTGAVTIMEYDCNTAFLGNANVLHDSSTEAEDPTQRVVSKIIEEIRLSRANSAVSMAEMSKTAALVAQTATRLFNAVKALKKGRFGDFADALGVTYTRRTLKGFSRSYNQYTGYFRKRGRRVKGDTTKHRLDDFLGDTWLEYSYAWKPLLSDVYDHAKAAAEIMTERQQVLRTVRHRSSLRRYGEEVSYPGTRKHSRKWTSTKFVEMEVNYRIPDGAVSIPTAFGLDNPLVVAWELVPFSFVADWFIPIGSFLNNLTAYKGLVFHSGWKTSKHEWSAKFSITSGKTDVSGGITYTFLNSTVTGDVSQFTIQRTLLGTFPSFDFPAWKDPRSFAHAASAIALLHSIFLRK